jgi:hypothetical protein
MIEIKKVGGGFVARATPPSSTVFIEVSKPISYGRLMKQLKKAGVHQVDVVDALLEADPSLRRKFQGPEEWFVRMRKRFFG